MESGRDFERVGFPSWPWGPIALVTDDALYCRDVTADHPFVLSATELVRGGLDLASDAIPSLQKALAFPLTETIETDDEAKELVEDEAGFHTLATMALQAFDEGSLPLGHDQTETDHMTAWKSWVKSIGKTTKRKGKGLFHPLRLALTGQMSGPDVGQLLYVLTTAESLSIPTLIPLQNRMDQLRTFIKAS